MGLIYTHGGIDSFQWIVKRDSVGLPTRDSVRWATHYRRFCLSARLSVVVDNITRRLPLQAGWLAISKRRFSFQKSKQTWSAKPIGFWCVGNLSSRQQARIPANDVVKNGSSNINTDNHNDDNHTLHTHPISPQPLLVLL